MVGPKTVDWSWSSGGRSGGEARHIFEEVSRFLLTAELGCSEGGAPGSLDDEVASCVQGCSDRSASVRVEPLVVNPAHAVCAVPRGEQGWLDT